MNEYNCIVVLGPTASGKTHFSCQLALKLNAEIISADSRQVYKYLNIGTGKDLNEYNINGISVPYHLIDIIEPEHQFYLHDFISRCNYAFNDILQRKKTPIICGGTGLYLDSLRKDFSLTQVPEDLNLRSDLDLLSKEELVMKLKHLNKSGMSHVDLNSKKRLIRAIEVALYIQQQPNILVKRELPYKPYYIGININVEERIQKISDRLIYRINNGMIEEVQCLLDRGLITHDRLQFLGLEYKFISMYLKNDISLAELVEKLRTAIFQFAKRQMTWFRKMEKEGVKIRWVDKFDDIDSIVLELKHLLNS